MGAPRKSNWAMAALISALPVLAYPVGDSDIWWHLSAAKWILAHGQWPATEAFSFTRFGSDWVDFEWLGQLIFYGAYCLGGLGGVWLLKTLLLLAAGACVYGLLASLRVPAPQRAFGAALWAVCVIPRADARLELFSLGLFAATAWLLEERGERSGREGRWTRSWWLWGGLFCLWANLHAGFVYGFALLVLGVVREAMDRRPTRLWGCVGAAAAGTLINPYGPRLHEMLWRHFRESGDLGAVILEWAPLGFERPGHWPTWLVMMIAVAATVMVWRHGKMIAPTQAVGLGVFGMAALRHARVAAFFSTLAIPFILSLDDSSRVIPKVGRGGRRAAVAGLIACFLFGGWLGMRVGLGRRVFSRELVPVQLSSFLNKHHGDYGSLRTYHPWGWGGFLRFRLGEGFRIFQDGRYVFHPLLLEAKQAVSSPELWGAFLDRYGVELAVLENLPVKMKMTRVYPDKTTRAFLRPYYVSFMPREEWALIYWDNKSLVFLRRDLLEERGWKEREYRLERPGDREALADVLQRGEVDAERLKQERLRRAKEMTSLSREL